MPGVGEPCANSVADPGQAWPAADPSELPVAVDGAPPSPERGHSEDVSTRTARRCDGESFPSSGAVCLLRRCCGRPGPRTRKRCPVWERGLGTVLRARHSASGPDDVHGVGAVAPQGLPVRRLEVAQLGPTDATWALKHTFPVREGPCDGRGSHLLQAAPAAGSQVGRRLDVSPGARTTEVWPAAPAHLTLQGSKPPPCEHSSRETPTHAKNR